MKQVEKIWAELSAKAQEVETPQESTELSEEVKVELALVDDIKKSFDKVKSIADKWESAASKLHGAARDVQEYSSDVEVDQKDAYSEFNNTLQLARKINEMAKELGAETPPIAKEVFSYDDLERLANYSEQAFNKIKSAIK